MDSRVCGLQQLHPQSDLLGLIQVMIVVFGDEPPVFSRPTVSASYPPYQATGPPNKEGVMLSHLMDNFSADGGDVLPSPVSLFR
ncbi:hypothetical protein MJG53_015940 [Ovis ammon polii x Ovis aries]|uniref:UEV domain-containing protein n=3 Tax=Ovis TaxID=9935 RepID=A0A835ZLG5_SHEEP|nr:hypothetical protein JEQ12_011893 [Ovis aries]KAI4532702.1 hypothetical protein MG293_017110 [Ovis ammon polii]KAI4555239.1 hypothetical protein MJT46_015625 [Ovis ammon polii x Ovis aries]KAI4564928.1 hypothetical protein MJG53_015940 [Ovis ammon polii x Ovis aries]